MKRQNRKSNEDKNVNQQNISNHINIKQKPKFIQNSTINNIWKANKSAISFSMKQVDKKETKTTKISALSTIS